MLCLEYIRQLTPISSHCACSQCLLSQVLLESFMNILQFSPVTFPLYCHPHSLTLSDGVTCSGLQNSLVVACINGLSLSYYLLSTRSY